MGKANNKQKHTDGLSNRFWAQTGPSTKADQEIQGRQARQVRHYGLEHLEQLGLISERDREALEGPPSQQKSKLTEWEHAWEQLENT